MSTRYSQQNQDGSHNGENEDLLFYMKKAKEQSICLTKSNQTSQLLVPLKKKTTRRVVNKIKFTQFAESLTFEDSVTKTKQKTRTESPSNKDYRFSL